MDEKTSKRRVRRALFGYRREEVQQLLVDRDVLQRGAESRLMAADARVAELESELSEMRAGVEQRDLRLRELERELAGRERTATEDAPRLLAHEVDAILAAAQDTATRIVARARSVSERDAGRMGANVLADVARLVAWREEAIPVIHEVEEGLREVRNAVEGFVRRLESSLAPLERLPMEGVAEALRGLEAGDGPAPPPPDGEEPVASPADRRKVREAGLADDGVAVLETGVAVLETNGEADGAPGSRAKGTRARRRSREVQPPG